MTGKEKILSSFWDLQTSERFCVSSLTSSADTTTKTGREVRALEVLLHRRSWRTRTSRAESAIVDLGPGSGVKARRIVEALSDRENDPVTYLPVDVSPYCSAFALLTVLGVSRGDDHVRTWEALIDPPRPATPREAMAGQRALARRMALEPAPVAEVRLERVAIPSRGLRADFVADADQTLEVVAAHPLRRGRRAVLVLLGQTIGNCTESEQEQFLRAVARSMAVDDLLLIDAGLRSDGPGAAEHAQVVTDAYQREAAAFMDHKASRPGDRFQVEYDRTSHQIQHLFEGPGGDRQHLGHSSLLDRGGLIDLLDRCGLRSIDSVSTNGLEGLGAGPDCTVVLADRR